MDVPVRFLCRYFGVSHSRYYQWKSKSSCIRLTHKKEVCKKIKEIFTKSRSTYGSPRVYQELKKQNIMVSENTVAKYMSEMNLDARLKKKYRIMTTDSNHSGPFADRVVKFEDENCLPKAPGEVLAGDITYLKVGNSFLYLAVVIDIFSREVVGWSMSESMETKLVLNALKDAMKSTSPDVQIIFHSDRGSQYASQAYRSFMKNSNIIPSMSRKGNCYDNCYAESWFSSLKKECIYRRSINTVQEMRKAVFEYIEVWYNTKRSHSSLGYLTPLEFKNKFQLAH